MTSRYTPPAVLLHWLMAIGLVVAFGLGLYMTGLSFSPLRLKLYSWHKWLGVTLLALAGLRVLWRLRSVQPAAMPGPDWQRFSASAVHGGLYGLILAVPLLGWTYSSAAGFPVVLFGLWPLPDLVAPDKALAAALKPWHRGAAWTLALLVGLHIVAALYHQLVLRDGLLRRMSLFRERRIRS